LAASLLLIVALATVGSPARRAEAATVAVDRAPAVVTATLSGPAMNPDVGPNCSAAGPPPTARVAIMIGALLLLFANTGGPRRRRRS
jgi:hypothetical protein